MTGRTPAAAARSFTEQYQRCIACVSRAVTDIRGGYYPSTRAHTLTINQGRPVRLAGESSLYLEVALNYRIVQNVESGERWRVVTAAYFHRFLDQRFQEIIAFHWHPEQRSDVVHPHLHLGAGARIGYERLHRTHVPTGKITIQDVLLFGITELGVEPLVDRETALLILGDTQVP